MNELNDSLVGSLGLPGAALAIVGTVLLTLKVMTQVRVMRADGVESGVSLTRRLDKLEDIAASQTAIMQRQTLLLENLTEVLKEHIQESRAAIRQIDRLARGSGT